MTVYVSHGTVHIEALLRTTDSQTVTQFKKQFMKKIQPAS